VPFEGERMSVEAIGMSPFGVCVGRPMVVNVAEKSEQDFGTYH
jgi:hypothetical protein